jgi:hypothetical protein
MVTPTAPGTGGNKPSKPVTSRWETERSKVYVLSTGAKGIGNEASTSADTATSPTLTQL